MRTSLWRSLCRLALPGLLLLASQAQASIAAQPLSGAAVAAGRLLVASPAMAGGYFAHTVILLTRHDRHGSLGVIINRPTSLPLAVLLPEHRRLAPLFLLEGGPLQPTLLSLVLAGRGLPDDFDDPGRLLFVSGTAEVLKILHGLPPGMTLRVYGGYCGWGPGQLQAEIRQGAWRVVEGDAALLFSSHPRLLWQRIVSRP